MNILGISCYYHDSAACLLQDGKVVAAVSEERFNRIKNSEVFPINAINYCIQAGGIAFGDLDYIGFYEKPFLKFSRVIIDHIRAYPFSLRSFLERIPNWLKDRLVLPLILKKELGFDKKVFFVKHHLSHAASAFLVSPFKEAAIITADGVGEWTTTTCGIGRGNDIKIIQEITYPDSLGLLYTAVTSYLGFLAHQGEGKVMGLAAYGQPRYLDKFYKIIQPKPDGSFRINQKFFGFNKGARMYSRQFINLFGKNRKANEGIKQCHCDIAASLQKVTEDTLINIANSLYLNTKMDNLCLAGGVFLNCVANNKIIENTPFSKVYIQPAAGDSGGALGVACCIENLILKRPRKFIMDSAYLGPEFSPIEIKRCLITRNFKFTEFNEDELLEFVAKRILDNKIVGWFQGRSEYGPRALGNRSILANPMFSGIKDLINKKVKKRESFRPYAPAILEEKMSEYFNLTQHSPFMLLAGEVIAEKRELIPGVMHVDKTARVQTVSKQVNPKFWRLIKAFETLTGIPILLNTSFNLRGEPIVCTPNDAVGTFLNSEMDYLVIGDFIASRSEN